MSAGAEGNDSPDAERSRIVVVPAPVAGDGHPSQHPHAHHHVLIEPDEDRWRWRRKIRQNPGQLAVYRIGVAIAGLLLICLGFISGPIPGPGGIPLVLLGLAVWASEFEWAHNLMQRFKVLLHRYQAWPARAKVLFWFGFVAICGTLGYADLLLAGVPDWLPTPLETLLLKLPGLQR